MDRNTIREETRRRLREVWDELADDETEIERQMPDVLRRMIEEAEIKGKHYQRVAEEALTERYREQYARAAEKAFADAEDLRKVVL